MRYFDRASRPSSVFCAVGLAFTLAACGPTDEPVEENNGTVTTDPVVCEGPKCDGITDRFVDAYDDLRNVDVADLTIIGAGLATDGLNDALGNVPYSNIALSETALYGSEEEVLGQTTVHDLDELKSGLTERFGEEAFATRVTEMRRARAQGEGLTWAESHFSIGPDLGHQWNVDISDDGVGSVGFDARASIETVVIAPYQQKTEALKDAPLDAIRSVRGWVMPRDFQDVVALSPGEAIAMRADGALGLNLGAGIPFLIATVANTLALHARLSFGARVGVAGKLDVQLIRGTGTDAWVDVGIDRQTVRDFSVALTTGWGLSGLPEVDLDLGVVDMSVTELAEKALRKQLDKNLAPSLTATSTSSSDRLSVARFRFDTSRAGDENVEQALAQAMRGDIRLAQAMSLRENSGVVQELDLNKDAHSEGNYVGFRFLGMEFYRGQNFATGTVHIEQNGQNQTLLFSELEERSGLFFTDREWEWRKLVSVESANGRLNDAQVNARMTIREGDTFLSRDQMLDHVDPFAAYIVGFDPMWSQIGPLADDLAEFVDSVCDRDAPGFRDCLEAIPGHPDVVARRTALEAEVDSVLSGGVKQGFDPAAADTREVARKLLDFKVEASARNDRPDVQFFGPEGKMITQIRFSDAALHDMMVVGQHENFRQTLEQVLRLMAAKRISDTARKQEKVDDYISDREERLDEIAELYGIATVEWADLEDVAQVSLDGQRVGNYGHMVLIPEARPQELDLASIAEHKGRILEKLIPEMVDLAEEGIFRDLDEPEEFVIAYALLWMASPADVEILADYVFDEDDANAFEDLEVYARGTSPLIGAGQFDIDQLLGSD